MSLPLVSSEDVIEGKFKEQRIFFDEESLKLMKYFVQRSYKQEYGATLCADKSQQDSHIRLRHIIKGTKETIKHELRCKETERIIGDFHTHPNQKKIYPSARDYHSMKDRSISCIGSNKAKPNIECYTKIYLKEEEDERDIIINRLLELETLAKSKKMIRRFKKEHNMLEDTLLNKYFRRFDPEENPYIVRKYIDKK